MGHRVEPPHVERDRSDRGEPPHAGCDPKCRVASAVGDPGRADGWAEARGEDVGAGTSIVGVGWCLI